MRVPRRLAPLAAVLLAGLCPAAALDEMPGETGWTGYLLAGAGGGAIKSNEVAGSVVREIGDATITSLSREADLEREVVPVVGGEVGYYFAGSGTWIVLGGTLEDPFRYDFSTLLGVRQKLGSPGVVAVDLLTSSAPARVYTDPFVTGRERETVDRTATGGRVTWDRIGGTGLELELTARVIDLEEEKSGADLGLGRTAREALERQGAQTQVRAGYRLPVHPRHRLTPRIEWRRLDLDGEAVAHDRLLAGLGWRFLSRHAVVTSEITLGRSGYDGEHPVFGKRRTDRLAGVMVTGVFPTIFRSRSWLLSGTVGAFEERSNIDFYDARVSLASAVVMYRF